MINLKYACGHEWAGPDTAEIRAIIANGELHRDCPAHIFFTIETSRAIAEQLRVRFSAERKAAKIAQLKALVVSKKAEAEDSTPRVVLTVRPLTRPQVLLPVRQSTR